MPEANPKLEGRSVVLRGSFNPSIFQPAWLGRHELIQKGEADNAQIDLISRELSSFECGEWLQIQVTADRFSASTLNTSYSTALCDLVAGIFALLEHTPLSMMGANSLFHYELSSEDRWHELGHLLAPKKPWQKVMDQPGTKSLTISGKSQRGLSDTVTVKVEPSIRVHPGVFVEVNQHFDGRDGEDLISKLRSKWGDCQTYAKEIVQSIMNEVPA